MKRSLSLVFLILLILCLGCDDFEKNTYRTLLTAGATYDGIMMSLGDAYKNGSIDEETKDKIVDVGNVFYGSYHSTREIFKLYLSARDKGDITTEKALEEKLNKSLAQTIAFLNSFVSYYNSFAEGVNGMKTWEVGHESN